MEIVPITFPLGQRVSTVFAFISDGRVGLFDAGCRGDMEAHILPELGRLGYSPDAIDWVVASHPDVDHFGGLDEVTTLAPSARRIAHVLDAPLMESVDTFFRERGDELAALGCPETDEAKAWLVDNGAAVTLTQTIDADATLAIGSSEVVLLHLPGHSRGHLGVWVEQSRTLAISDAILGDSVPFADGTPSFPPTYRFVDDYLATIDAVSERAPETLLTAHYGEFHGSDVGKFLQLSATFAHALEETCEQVVGSEPMTITDIIRAVDDAIGQWPKPTALTALGQPVIGHLERLEVQGIITRSGEGVTTTWKKVSGA